MIAMTTSSSISVKAVLIVFVMGESLNCCESATPTDVVIASDAMVRAFICTARFVGAPIGSLRLPHGAEAKALPERVRASLADIDLLLTEGEKAVHVRPRRRIKRS